MCNPILETIAEIHRGNAVRMPRDTDGDVFPEVFDHNIDVMIEKVLFALRAAHCMVVDELGVLVMLEVNVFEQF